MNEKFIFKKKKWRSFTLSIPRSRKISNIPANSLVNSNSVSPKPEEFQQKEPMVPPYNVLITGSTKGIGYALARQFLKEGDNVVICSRSAERVESSVQSLREEFGEQRVWGTKCDVREGEDVKNLVAFLQKNLKYIDIWINNAGSNAYSFKPLVEASDEDLIEVVTTNALGLMICCREAIKMMLNQPRGGHIFNIDGAGSDGRPTPRFAAYGATKRSVVHLTKSLQAELRMQDVKNVVVHNLSPGMVTTDLLMSGADTKQAKFFINVLAEPPEVAQLANTKIEVWSEKPLGEDISNLSARRDVWNAYAPTIKSFFDETPINLNMFSSIMLNWVVSNTNSSFIITKELQWSFTFLMKIGQDFLEPNFLTYSQTHSSIFGLNTAPGHNTLLLTPPSYKIAPTKVQ
ncbi:chlorophyll(ide) b reductase NOL [Cucumis melo var. makuwa]|uniref:chlorophyll(ide) b reductase n=1 Tax=Cucumis melo var. makuwa TaxID=1194695 RepID=A0A5A7SR18_CUCMM|nr:chlorophyll(ide) b reductase NOL [Cucumis melo var. makuwa]TYK30399.1 chlorophyll(ide) b reductase NOL [Cucumis melo var. makuwa]